uniref:Methyltransferase n=1 Tax=viral metagenome TaxID=1070528 RepID=A0A6C0M0P9_9ZZZZ
MWHIKDKNIQRFFLQNIDRLFVVNVLFPTIGSYLKEHGKNNVLNIGFDETYNIYDRDFFENDEINFYGLDKDDRYFLPNKWKKIYKLDLTYNLPDKMPKFDTIIDYGVIGWPGININLNEQQITQYIKNISLLLETNGLYFLKLDYKYTKTTNKNHIIKNQSILNIISKFFVQADFYNVSKKTLTQNKDVYYETFVFKLKN